MFLLANCDKGKNTEGPHILSDIMCRWLIYGLPINLYDLHLRYSLTALDTRYDKSVEDTTKRITGKTGGGGRQKLFQYCLLQIPYKRDSSWPWTLNTQNLGKWLEQTAQKTVLIEKFIVAQPVNKFLPLIEPKYSLLYSLGPAIRLLH